MEEGSGEGGRRGPRCDGKKIEDCKPGLFQDASFARDLQDEPQAFVPISWMCKKQTAVPHSSAESEIISLDAVCEWEACQHYNCGIAFKKECHILKRRETFSPSGKRHYLAQSSSSCVIR